MSARSRLALAEGRNAMFRAAPEPYIAALLVNSYRQFARNNRLYISPLDLRLELNQEEEQAAISAFEEALEYAPEDQE